MPYQIVVLVEEFSAEKFRQPESRATAWGTAVRAEEAGKLFWSDDLYVEPCPDLVPLQQRLPREWRTVPWKGFSLGGDALQNLEYFLNEALSYAHYDLVKVHELLCTLLEGQPRWAVFLTGDRDESEEPVVQYLRTAEDLRESIGAVYRREGGEDKTIRGFVFLSGPAGRETRPAAKRKL